MALEQMAGYNKGVERFLNSSLKEKDILISPSFWNKRMPPKIFCQVHEKLMQQKSEEFLKKGYKLKSVNYGNREREVYDVICPDIVTDETPVLIAFHGGYWQAMGRDQMYGPSEAIVDMGGIVVTVGYELMGKESGLSMSMIMEEACMAMLHICTVTFKNSKNIYLWAHCAGVVNALWGCLHADIPETAVEAIKGFVLISGVYDMLPVSKTSENHILNMTEEEVRRLSLVSEENMQKIQTRFKHSKFLIVISQYDSDEFFRQYHYFVNMMKLMDLQVHETVFQRWDHFEPIEMMCNPHSIITRKISEFMGLC